MKAKKLKRLREKLKLKLSQVLNQVKYYDLKVKVYPQPDGIYNLRFDMAKPQGLITADATKIKVPHNPVIQMAFAMALRERGETGGQSAAEQFAIASTALSDAIAIDANRYPDETTFMAV